MKLVFQLTTSLAAKVRQLIRAAEVAHPGMPEVAAMVYVGDIYALREQAQAAKHIGHAHHYVGDEPFHR
jgi:hypothetical protein